MLDSLLWLYFDFTLTLLLLYFCFTFTLLCFDFVWWWKWKKHIEFWHEILFCCCDAIVTQHNTWPNQAQDIEPKLSCHNCSEYFHWRKCYGKCRCCDFLEYQTLYCHYHDIEVSLMTRNSCQTCYDGLRFLFI